MKRTRAIEILDTAQAKYELGSFEAEDFTAEEVAEKLNIPLESVYKTLVARGEHAGVVMAVVPGDKELSLKKLAQAIGDKRTELVKLNELERLTGYLKGGCSPLGGKKEYPVYLDENALLQERLSISAGLRGLQMLISPDEFLRVSHATVAELSD
ncbi:MAG TPA: Cys-tRNA(Pro) deacylase [Oligoflexia bacterium]|nr:Cys-tRNA(Pro) deacylase [Oligoflexia bacterium]